MVSKRLERRILDDVDERLAPVVLLDEHHDLGRDLRARLGGAARLVRVDRLRPADARRQLVSNSPAKRAPASSSSSTLAAMRRSAGGRLEAQGQRRLAPQEQMMEGGDPGHAPDARADDGAFGDLDFAEAAAALELEHAGAAGDGERAHEKVEPVVFEEADDAAVVAVLAHGHGQARQRQHVADERRARDELVDAGAQRLFARGRDRRRPPPAARASAPLRAAARPVESASAPSTATTISCGTRVCAIASASSPSRVA